MSSAGATHIPQTSNGVEYNGLEIQSDEEAEEPKQTVFNTTKVIAIVVVLLLIILATVLITKAVIDSQQADSSANTDSEDELSQPRNLIIIIGDGMGQSYNAAYRKYKNLTRTTLDKHLKVCQSTIQIHR